MTKVIHIILIGIFLIGCTNKEYSNGEVNNTMSDITLEKSECSLDSDCIRGGCSGTSCHPKGEQIFTTCEYLPEYECYKLINCGCVNNKCQWEKTGEFEGCFEKNDRNI